MKTFATFLILLTACAATGGGDGVDRSADVSVEPSRGHGEKLTGTFGTEGVEGGCAYLEVDHRTRYEVLYPPSWRLERNPIRLVAPDGSVAATGGEQITVRGRMAPDMVSICQIGPIFQATEVVSVEPR